MRVGTPTTTARKGSEADREGVDGPTPDVPRHTTPATAVLHAGRTLTVRLVGPPGLGQTTLPRLWQQGPPPDADTARAARVHAMQQRCDGRPHTLAWDM